MEVFQLHIDKRFPASNIRLLEAEGMSIVWGTFQLNEELDIQKYSSDTNKSRNNYFLSHFCISGNTKSTATERQFQICDEQHSIFFLKERSAVNLHIQSCQMKINPLH